MSTAVRLTLNGAEARLDVEGGEPLLLALRHRAGLTGARLGCGLEQCGACMVLVDGDPRYACTLPAADADGRTVVTVEGLAADPLGAALLQAFVDEQAGQCGYCLAGILVSAHALLRRSPRPDRAEIAAALDGHLCRCGAHPRILRAVARAAERIAGGEA